MSEAELQIQMRDANAHELLAVNLEAERNQTRTPVHVGIAAGVRGPIGALSQEEHAACSYFVNDLRAQQLDQGQLIMRFNGAMHDAEQELMDRFMPIRIFLLEVKRCPKIVMNKANALMESQGDTLTQVSVGGVCAIIRCDIPFPSLPPFATAEKCMRRLLLSLAPGPAHAGDPLPRPAAGVTQACKVASSRKRSHALRPTDADAPQRYRGPNNKRWPGCLWPGLAARRRRAHALIAYKGDADSFLRVGAKMIEVLAFFDSAGAFLEESQADKKQTLK